MDFEKSFYWLVTTSFAFIAAIFYLCGYWSTFGINVFDYLSFSDAVSKSLIPLMVIALPILCGTLLGVLKPSTAIPILQSKNYVVTNKDLTMMIAFGLPTTFLFVIAKNLSDKWLFGGLVTMLTAAVLDKIFSKSMQQSLLFIILKIALCFLLLSFCQGKRDAHMIIEGTEYFYTEFDNEKYRHIGYLSDKHFYIDSENIKFRIVTGEKTDDLVFVRVQNKTSLRERTYFFTDNTK